jgi:hypothetical protein
MPFDNTIYEFKNKFSIFILIFYLYTLYLIFPLILHQFFQLLKLYINIKYLSINNINNDNTNIKCFLQQIYYRYPL